MKLVLEISLHAWSFELPLLILLSLTIYPSQGPLLVIVIFLLVAYYQSKFLIIVKLQDHNYFILKGILNITEHIATLFKIKNLDIEKKIVHKVFWTNLKW